MEVSWNYYRHKGSGWLIVNGKTFKVENMDQALELLQKMIEDLTRIEMERPQ